LKLFSSIFFTILTWSDFLIKLRSLFFFLSIHFLRTMLFVYIFDGFRYDKCADFTDSELFTPFPEISFSPYVNDPQNIIIGAFNGGDQAGNFTTTVQCYNNYPQTISLSLQNTVRIKK
jgi:hypothetical protein